MTLTNKQRQQLKGLAHLLKPVVRLGDAGLTEAVMSEIEQALAHHELIKVKLVGADRTGKRELADEISQRSGAENVQMIGNMVVLYRPSPKAKIDLSP